MRRVVAGTGDDGRSKVLSDGRPETVVHQAPGALPQVLTGGWQGSQLQPGEAVVHLLWSFDAVPTPPSVDASPPTDASFAAPPGATKWIVTEMGPDLEVPMHKTATVDYGIVLAGEVRLGLETGSVDLSAGDAVVVGGVRHCWHAGPRGCVIATVLVGLPDGYHPENVPGGS